MAPADGQERQEGLGSNIGDGRDSDGPPTPKSTGIPSHSAAAAADALKDFARGRPSSKRSSATSSESYRSIQHANPFRDSAPADPPPLPNSRDFSNNQHVLSSHPRRDLSSSRPARNGPSASKPPFFQPQGSQSSEGSGNSSSQGRGPPSFSRRPNLQGLPLPPIPHGPRGRLPVRQHHASGTKTPSSMPLASSGTASRSRTPMKLSDLGQDYTRYPVAQSRPSTTNLSSSATPFTTSGGVTPLLTGSTKASPYPSTTNLGLAMDPEKADMWLLDDRICAPYTAEKGAFPMYTDEKEEDDDMHTPAPDDDVNFKPKFRDFMTRRQLGAIGGLVFMFLGIFCIFILLPVLSYTGHAVYGYPYDTPDTGGLVVDPADYVNDVRYPLFKNIRTSLVDPDTPKSALKRKTLDGEDWDLVFSDEFRKPGRTFYPGDDPYWTAPDIWYGSTQDLEWYDPDAANTANGTLQLKLEQFPNHNLLYRSGMLNSWNQVCMKGGALEMGVSLAGPGGASGLWPGAWTMGNLGRPGYKASTEGLWPYTYNSCDQGITPNQSMTDGTSYLPGQRLSSCTCPGEDHPTPGTGRGAPEIDVFEASADPTLHLGLVTQSYQVAPFDIWWQPNSEYLAIPNFNVTQMNGYCGGPFQQAVSGQTELNNKWYDGHEYQKYGFEYEPGIGSEAYIRWFVGDDMSFMMTGDAVGPNGNVAHRPISEEPMAIVMNLGFSTAWTGIHMDELRFPTTMYVDYVRWYQKPGEHMVTCDPPGYETTQYIQDHLVAYTNNNLTLWKETGYPWPKHKLNTNNCK